MSTSGLATPQPHPLLPAWGLRQHALLVAELLCAAILCRLLAFAEGLPPHPQPSLLGGVLICWSWLAGHLHACKIGQQPPGMGFQRALCANPWRGVFSSAQFPPPGSVLRH